VPEPSPESTLDRSFRVAALVGDVANGILLFQGVSSRQRAKPVPGARERGTTLPRIVLWRYASEQLARTPADGALGFVDERAKHRYPLGLNERIRVL
jgi:hypothetical protein